MSSWMGLEVPQIILGSPLWHCLAPLSKDVYQLGCGGSVTAVLVALHDADVQLVMKAWSAERASEGWAQIAAELDAAECFGWHPSMATPVAACYDEDGNFFSISPYAGCSLASLINHPDWYTAVSAQERLEFIRVMLLQMFTVFDIMQKTGVGHFYRDVKPDNVVISPITGRTAVIDYGLKVWSNLENYHDGETEGYWTPETVNPGPNGKFETFFSSERRCQATNNTTDSFLASYMALQAAVGLDGLPWLLQSADHDTSTAAGYVALIRAHASAAAAGYDQLIARVTCPVARDFFEQSMCSDPAQRLTPAEALEHPWLAGCAAAVQQAVTAATPAFQHMNQQLVDLFSGVSGNLLHQQQPQPQQEEPSAACSTDTATSIDVSCCATASMSSEHSTGFPTDVRCSGSSDTETADQHAAGAAAAAATSCKWKSSLLQRGRKLLSKLSHQTRSARAGCKGSSKAGSSGVDSGVTAAVVVEVQGWVEDEPNTASVPGLCGLRWFGRSGRRV